MQNVLFLLTDFAYGFETDTMSLSTFYQPSVTSLKIFNTHGLSIQSGFFLIRVSDKGMFLSRACYTNSIIQLWVLAATNLLAFKCRCIFITLPFQRVPIFIKGQQCALFYTKFFHNIFYLFLIFNFFMCYMSLIYMFLFSLLIFIISHTPEKRIK
jgi:hypothetical protein